jgi:hypothetical protein
VPSPRRLSTRAVAALGALYAVLVTLLLINPAAATTGQPTYTQALTSQLASEYRDPALATGVVASLSPSLLTSLEATVPLTDVKRSSLLAYRPMRTPATGVKSVIAFEFGNRVASDGTISAGPVNQAIAAATAKYAETHHVPIYAQQQIAQILFADGVKNVTSINPVVGTGGQITYLSTAGVVSEVVSDAATAGVPLGKVGIIAFADHADRAVLTTRAAHLAAGVPTGVNLPATYDTSSGQSWTTNRLSYLELDLTDRILAIK